MHHFLNTNTNLDLFIIAFAFTYIYTLKQKMLQNNILISRLHDNHLTKTWLYSIRVDILYIHRIMKTLTTFTGLFMIQNDYLHYLLFIAHSILKSAWLFMFACTSIEVYVFIICIHYSLHCVHILSSFCFVRQINLFNLVNFLFSRQPHALA